MADRNKDKKESLMQVSFSLNKHVDIEFSRLNGVQQHKQNEHSNQNFCYAKRLMEIPNLLKGKDLNCERFLLVDSHQTILYTGNRAHSAKFACDSFTSNPIYLRDANWEELVLLGCLPAKLATALA